MRKNEASPIVSTICLLLFSAFAFIYLYVFQADLLFYAQHVLSGGTTVYQPLVGAVIITLVLLLLALFLSRLLGRAFYFAPALLYLPSALALASLTDINITEDSSKVFGFTCIVSLAVLVLFGLFYLLAKHYPVAVKLRNTAEILTNICLNLFIMLCLFLYVGLTANSNEKDHCHLAAEQALKGRFYEQAALEGKKQEVGSERLTTIRAFALGKTGLIGEHFFEYPVEGNSSALLPTGDNRMLLFPEMRIYQFIGGIPAPGMEARECLSLLEKRGQLRAAARDYLLLACLLDKDLDSFAGYLARDVDSTTALPKHYREALTLYNHLRSAPVLEYSSPEMEADFADFQSIAKKNPAKVLRENASRDSYGNTYWFYYFFTASRAFSQSVSSEK